MARLRCRSSRASIYMRRHVVYFPVMHIRGLMPAVSFTRMASEHAVSSHLYATWTTLSATINTCSTHISASHAAGGEPPLLMHRGATHPCTNSAARAAGGDTPPLRAHLGDPHPAQVPQLERPRRAHAPLSQSHKCPRALTATLRCLPMYMHSFTHTMRQCAPSDVSEEGSGYESG